jgi:hypothetical protein
VHLGRLRQKLNEYYQGEGAQSDLVLCVRPGTYRLEYKQAATKTLVEIPLSQRPHSGVNWRIATLAASVVAVASMALALHSYIRHAPRAAPRPELPRFWAAFFGDGQPVKLIMPTPVFFVWRNFRVRDVEIDDFDGYRGSPFLNRLDKEFGPPRFSQSYTVASDSLAAVHLAQFCAARGHYLDVAETSDLSLELFGNHNLILMGFPHTNADVSRFLAKTNFEADHNRVLNRHPAPNEPAIWQSSTVSGERQTWPGLIVLLPGQAAGSRLLLIAGGHTASLTSFLISPEGLRALDAVWARNGSPNYFEMVVTAEVKNNSAIKAQPAAFRKVPADIWKQDVTVR